MLEIFAIWVVISGMDDLFFDAAFLFQWLVRNRLGKRRVRIPTSEELNSAPRKPIAIFVPLWREYQVIRHMIEHNLAVHWHEQAEFFIGVYPNDGPTLAAARELEGRFPSVHVAVCPHEGPTSKADNLNWIFQRMMLLEEERGARFEIVMTHDAEDLIHPEALRWVNYYSRWHDMVQVPVLPIATPVGELLHGVYCDEFAEYQSKDMPTRQFLGGFLPSCGVGTGFSRRALDRLGAAYANCIFEPASLTEDYENGFRVHRLGCSQLFLPLVVRNGKLVATRGYFPRRFRAAVKQRTRWVTGIGLQSWEMNSWPETRAQLYWFWRDRKGLIGNLIGPVANVVFLYGVVRWLAHGEIGPALRLILDGNVWVVDAFAFSMTMQAVHMAMRMRFSARIYGWKFASLVPARVFLGNAINSLATVSAIYRFARSKWTGEPLVWVKTDHAYPTRAALMVDRRPLGEILVGLQHLTQGDLEMALATRLPGLRIGEHLVRMGKITEDVLYECLSLQQNVAFQDLDRGQVSPAVVRTLPAGVSRRWKVLGFKVAAGQLFVAGPDVPCDEMNADLRRFSSLEIRFHLVTPGNFEALSREFLPVAD